MIIASHLHKSFASTVAVDDLSLSIAPGEIYGLVGPDGAGKTTTIRLLCGALQPDRGEVSILGYDIQHQTEQARTHIGYLAQRFSLYEDLTVLENIRFFAEVRGLSANEWQPRCMEILKFVGLDTFVNRRAGQLSGGMKQKLGLAAALVHRPQVLLLDEPTTGVDPVTRQDFWQLIIRLTSQPLPPAPLPKGEGGLPSPRGGGAGSDGAVSVLVSTPYMDEAARCHRVGFMREGKLLVEGTPAELRANLDGAILELRGQPLKTLRDLARADPQVDDAQMFGDRLHLRVQPGAAQDVIARLQAQIPAQGGSTITLLREIPSQLEDVFISLLETNS
jgi:ABC-2 type transport system ATP-binding protein